MTNSEIIMLLAIFLGPIVAVQVSQFLDRRRQKHGAKEWVFKTLMRTRGTALNPSHVEALNMIDIEFHGARKKDRAVVSAWKLYLDNLGDSTTAPEVLFSKRNDLLIDLLYTMGTALGYDFDKEHIKNTVYYPQASVDIELEQQLIRRGVVSLLKGETEIPIRINNLKNPDEPAA